MNSLLIAGIGYTGFLLAKSCLSSGWRVYGLSRRPRLTDLEEFKNFTPIACDLTRRDTIPELPPVDAIVICVAPDHHQDKDYHAVYLDGIQNLLERVHPKTPPKTVLFTSSTSVWSRDTEGWVDESVPCRPGNGRGRIIEAAEKQILSSGFPAIILRLAGIYGPERNRMGAFLKESWPSFESNRCLNLIHVQDACSVIRGLMESAKPGVYVGCDGRPVCEYELYRFLCEASGKHSMWPDEEVKEPHGKRVRSLKIPRLKIPFKFPSYREGYEAIGVL